MRRSLNILGVFGAALVFGATSAQAQTVVGNFNGAGSATYGGTPSLVTVTPASGIITLETLDGIFEPIPQATIGTISSLLVGAGPMSVPNFISVLGYNFSISSIAPASYSSAACFIAPAAGQTCGIAGSGFNWSNVDNGMDGINSSAAFNFVGSVVTPTNQTFQISGIYTAQFSNASYQTVLSNLNAAPAGSYSLNIQAVTTTPEPATIALMGTGLLALAGVARRRRSTV